MDRWPPPRDDADEPPKGGGRRHEADFHGQKWSNETHGSTTDPDARLYKKGQGMKRSSASNGRRPSTRLSEIKAETVGSGIKDGYSPILGKELVMSPYPSFADAVGDIAAPPEAIFDFLDDQSNLSSHMGKSSWMMLETTMDIYMDDKRTRSIGSKFGFTGRILGVPLSVDEVVTTREPPLRKSWQTTSEPRLWVIGQYKMGLELSPQPVGAQLRVFIEYAAPKAGIPRVLGLLFGKMYARWCTRQMVTDAQKHFVGQDMPVASHG